MADKRVRREIALRAAQLMYAREESEYFTAKRKAARQIGLDPRYNPKNLPSNREIRDELQILARMLEGPARLEKITAMRIEALRLMHRLERFRPRLIGSVLTGHVREGSDVDLHIFADSISAVTDSLEEAGYREGLDFTVERKRIIKHNEEREFTHVHLRDRFDIELTVYASDKINYKFRSSITGKPIERADADVLAGLIRRENPDLDLDGELERLEDHVDRFELYRMLLLPLENVKQSPKWHPEGDALYHSLQVFDLARLERGYDEEFLLAALLHDVGKAIDPRDHVGAAIEALEGSITDRTAFLVAHHMQAHELAEGTLGHRASKRLRASEDYDDLMLLHELDKAGRRRGVAVPSVDEALDAIRELADA